MSCSNNLKQITLACVNCADTNQGLLPPNWGIYPNIIPAPNNGEGGLFFHLLPFMEQQNFYNANLMPTSPQGVNVGPNGVNYPTYSEWGNAMQSGATTVNTLLCPSDPTVGMGWAPKSMISSYAVNGQVFRFYSYWSGSVPAQRYPAAISDGTSQTIFFTEKEAVYYGSAWAPAGNMNIYPNWGSLIASNELGAGQPLGPASIFQVQPRVGCSLTPGGATGGCGTGNVAASPHTGGINAAMGDGSVRFVAQGTSPNTWWYALTPNMGDILGPDW
jgi:prepilin-type processing-associated H-X9-DG protein